MFGLRKIDIICYLPVERFLPQYSTWEEALAACGEQDLKEFIKDNGGRVTAKALDQIAQDADNFDREFLQLSNLLKNLAGIGDASGR